MLNLNRLISFLLIFFMFSAVFAQTNIFGTSLVRNYSRSDFHAGSQTWDIQQGSNGMMYFANNSGLLEFDGINWNLYPLPNGSVMRAIKSTSDGIIYAGGFNEIGYYEINNMGGAIYKSITNLLPEELSDFGEVWKIFIHSDGIIFQTYTQVMFYKDNKINVIKAPSIFHFSFLVNNEYYINDMEKGLMRLAMGKLYPLKGVDKLIGKKIWGLLPFNDKILISTESDGVFLYNGNSLETTITSSNKFLKKNQIYTTELINPKSIAFGTIQNGLLICDFSGNQIQHINNYNGLQNNTILCIKQDSFGNLWLGTDRGIDFVQINSPLLQLSNNYGVSAGYAAIISNNILYLGTNQGLLTKEISNLNVSCIKDNDMTLIEETKGQVWTLAEVDGSLFCGHNAGTFIIDGNKAEKISDIPGAWIFLPVPNNSNKIIAGTFTGFSLYEKLKGKWKFKKQIKGFSESSRSMEFDIDGSLWMTHGYKGIYHISFNNLYDSIINIDYYNSKHSKLNNQVLGIAKINDEIFFTSSGGILKYDKVKDIFIRNEKLNKIFNNQLIRSIKLDSHNNIWYFTEDANGVLRVGEDGNYVDVKIPFKYLKGKFIHSFEFVYPYNEKNVFFGTENGFIYYQPSLNKDYNYPFSTYLKSMHTSNYDSTFKIDESQRGKPISLEFENNNIEFIFAANDFENLNNIKFSSFLEGYDKEWSEWHSRNTKEYTNLYEGEYVFKVKSKNDYGTITKEQKIEFTITPPFLRSFVAFILYFLIFIICIFILIQFLKKRFKRAKKRNEKEQQELFRKKEQKLRTESLLAEKEIIRLRNDKLREGIKMKDKELANSTIEMLHKNEMLIALRDELKKLSDLSKDENHKHEVKHLMRKINKEIDNEKQWQVFEIHFENVHEEFLERIKNKYPKLTPRELKLCAYLRMNISSKEISVLMNISTRGVEISRYRLRKKLELDRETNLTDFVLSF